VRRGNWLPSLMLRGPDSSEACGNLFAELAFLTAQPSQETTKKEVTVAALQALYKASYAHSGGHAPPLTMHTVPC